jgi:hypothetical protein
MSACLQSQSSYLSAATLHTTTCLLKCTHTGATFKNSTLRTEGIDWSVLGGGISGYRK